MRQLLTVLLIAYTASVVRAQAPEFFPLKPGTVKRFQATVNQNTNVGGQSTMSLTLYFKNEEEVIGTAKVDDKPAVLVRTTRRDSIAGRPMTAAEYTYKTENYYQVRPQGVFLLANFTLPADTVHKPDSTRYNPPLQVLKLATDSSANWKMGVMKMQGITVDLSAQIAGKEDVETPAGSFKNCLKVKSSSERVGGALEGIPGLTMTVNGGDFASTSWYAPGVGLVKQDVSTRLVMGSPSLPPGMTAELNFQQNLVLTRRETAAPPKKETKKK